MKITIKSFLKRRAALLWISVFFICCLFTDVAFGSNYPPTKGWRVSSPEAQGMDAEKFMSTYLYSADGYHVGISEAVYDYTVFSRPPEDGKLRKLKPAYNWLKLSDEFLHPRPDAQNTSPVNYSWVYTSE